MQIPKRIDYKTVVWCTEPDYCLYDQNGNTVIKLWTLEECYDYWDKLGNPWNYSVLNRVVGNRIILQER